MDALIKREEQCSYSRHSSAHEPPGWAQNKTAMCGINWPHETPLRNISDCCAPGATVEVSHACFHFCEVNTSGSRFSQCVWPKFGKPSAMLTECNRAVSHPVGDDGSDGGSEFGRGVSGGEIGALVVVGIVAIAALGFVGYRWMMSRRAVRLPADEA